MLDERGALERIDAKRGGNAARLGLLDEARLQRGGAPSGGPALEGFAQVLFLAGLDLKPQTAAVGAKPGFRQESRKRCGHSTSPPFASSRFQKATSSFRASSIRRREPASDSLPPSESTAAQEMRSQKRGVGNRPVGASVPLGAAIWIVTAANPERQPFAATLAP
jgi:hypothetical protein